MIDLRLGRWQSVLADVTECDAVITDPPYSERTHTGQRTGSSTRTPTIKYDAMTDHNAREFAKLWSARCRWWSVIWSDHTAQAWHEKAWEGSGWYVFAPLAYVKDVYAPRLSGDGPALGCEWITVARPRHRLPEDRAGSRPGWYPARGRYSCDAPSGIAGQKDVDCARKIIRDYTKPGDLIVDPFAGSGTTLIAARQEGRDCIGAEMDPDTYAKAMKRIEKPWTPNLF